MFGTDDLMFGRPADRPAGLIKTLKNTKLTKMQLDFKEI